MQAFLDGISVFFQENATWLSVTSAVTAIGGGFMYYLTKKVIPTVTNKILSGINKVVTKMFGGEVEGVSDAVTELPIMERMKSWEHELHIQNEMKLIELKNKLVSPKLSSVERISYQALYDKLMLEVGDTLSPATKSTLEAIEQASKE